MRLRRFDFVLAAAAAFECAFQLAWEENVTRRVHAKHERFYGVASNFVGREQAKIRVLSTCRLLQQQQIICRS